MVLRFLKIELKARVAQVLLQYAWHKTIKTGEDQRPWRSFDGVPVLRLMIPRHEVDQIVLAGTSGQALSFGLLSFTKKAGFLVREEQQYYQAHRDSHRHCISGNCKREMPLNYRTVSNNGIPTPLRTSIYST